MTPRSRWAPPAILLASFFAAAWPHRADEPLPSPPVPTDLQERVEVRLVQIRVFALDKDGRPVTDLRSEEIRIRDAGKTYGAAFLDPVTDREGPAPHVRLQLLAPGGPEQPADARDGEPRSWVLFIDRENEPREGRDAIAAGLESFVERAFGPADRVAVLSYAGEVRLEAGFTSDRETLKRAIREAYSRSARPAFSRDQRIRMFVQRLRACDADDPQCIPFAIQNYSEEIRQHAAGWLGALEGILRYAAGAQGRKAVLAVTRGPTLDPGPEMREALALARDILYPALDEGASSETRLQELTELAIRLDVALHLVSPPRDPLPGFGARFDTPTAPGANPFEASQRQALAELAGLSSDTGGRSLLSDDPVEGLAEAVTLERSGYTLGYYVDEPPRPNRSRRIRLECTRPGVELIGPRGYYQEVQPKKPIRGGVRLVGSRPVDTGPGRTIRLDFQVQLEPQDLGYRRVRSEYQTNFGLEITVHAEGGLPLARVYHFIQHALDRKTWREGDLPPLTVDGWIELSEGSYELRAVVTNPRDESEGRFSRALRVGAPPRT